MKTVTAFSRAFLAIAVLALGATQLSCSVNDYCLNCGTDDGGTGSNDANDAGDDPDAPPDAGCVPTGAEECDGEDNDCNGLIDDGTLPQADQPCDNQVGACTGGVKFCESGVYKCTKNPSAEICDGEDNDCNGTIDNGDPGGGAKCGTDMGECQAGTKRCVASSTTCNESPTCDVLNPAANCCLICENFIDNRLDPEVCNGKDDNCSGFPLDEGLTNLGACTWPASAGTPTNVGECNIGTLSCMGGNPVCAGAIYPRFETCNGDDDDCDGLEDEIFNKFTDPTNCGNCGVICQPVTKTCAGGTNSRMACTDDTGCPGSTCAINSQPCCGPACAPTKPANQNGTCAFRCNVGFKDLNTTATDGCEYKCSPTGNEECDGADNDCDGNVDEGITAPVNLCLTPGVCAGTTPVCRQAQGWKCEYPTATYEPTEVSCDNLNNDCDSNVDESHPGKGLACDDGGVGTCRDVGVDGCNAGDPDGALVCLRSPETGTQCDNNTDDNGDGKVNDGCPTVGPPETGADCNEASGSAVNNDASASDTKINDGCPQSPLVQTGMGTESCNAQDDDCDGQTDEGTTGPGTALTGRDWVDIGNGKQMMKHEASRPDASGSNVGINNSTVCSRAGTLPWVNVTYGQAQLACAAISATLCTEEQWHRACSVIAPSTYPVSASTGATLFVEAEDYSGIAYSPGVAEGTCTGSADDDADGRVNDGCAKVGTFSESNCINSVDDDLDGTVNDGCPAIKSTMQSWVSDYTTGYSGISSMEAVPNTSTGSVTMGNAATLSPRLDYLVNFSQTGTYHVWIKIFNYGITTSDTVHVAVNAGTPPQAATASASPTVLGCTSNANCTSQPGTTCADTNANGALDTCVGWVWVDASATFTVGATGDQTVSVYMGDDGVKIDKIAVTTSGTAPVDTILGKGGTWAYETNTTVYQAMVCNGSDRVANDGDPVIASGTLAQCHSNTGSGIFDMSGNVKEWTQAHVPGENPVRGGASNNTGVGISCPLNFTLADDSFFFPNIGFRCCK